MGYNQQTGSGAEQKKKEGLFYLHWDFRPWQSILLTLAVMLVLVFVVNYFAVPNPNMILIAGLVICSAICGYSGGVVAAVIMLIYTLYFFSEGNDFLTFSDENMQKVWVSLFGIVVDMIFVCDLKRRENAAFARIRNLTKELERENRLLQESSAVDALTKIGNRLALRKDYDGYRDRDLIVTMMDIDDFKEINDIFGHNQGDRALAETGRLLSETFGKECCYRYGGDEFLIICPGIEEEEYLKKVDSLMEKRPHVDANGKRRQIGYSIGYIHGKTGQPQELRELVVAADERMYRAKRQGKNKVVGRDEITND